MQSNEVCNVIVNIQDSNGMKPLLFTFSAVYSCHRLHLTRLNFLVFQWSRRMHRSESVNSVSSSSNASISCACLVIIRNKYIRMNSISDRDLNRPRLKCPPETEFRKFRNVRASETSGKIQAGPVPRFSVSEFLPPKPIPSPPDFFGSRTDSLKFSPALVDFGQGFFDSNWIRAERTSW